MSEFNTPIPGLKSKKRRHLRIVRPSFARQAFIKEARKYQKFRNESVASRHGNADGGFGGFQGLTGDAYGSFAAMSNGAPTIATTGQTFLREANNGAGIVPATVSNGALIAPDSCFSATAAYTGFLLR